MSRNRLSLKNLYMAETLENQGTPKNLLDESMILKKKRIKAKKLKLQTKFVSPMAAKLTIKTGKKRNENYYKMQNMTKSYALPEIRTSRHQDKVEKIVKDDNSSVDKVRGFTPKSSGEVDVLYSGSPEESHVELIKNPEGYKTIELAKPEKQAGRNMVNRSIDIAYLQQKHSENQLIFPPNKNFDNQSSRVESLFRVKRNRQNKARQIDQISNRLNYLQKQEDVIMSRLDGDRRRAEKLSVSRQLFNNSKTNLQSYKQSKDEEWFEKLNINQHLRESTRMNVNMIHKKIHLQKKISNLQVRRNSRELDRRRASNSSSSLSKNRKNKDKIKNQQTIAALNRRTEKQKAQNKLKHFNFQNIIAERNQIEDQELLLNKMMMMEEKFMEKLQTTRNIADIERKNFSTVNATSMFISSTDQSIPELQSYRKVVGVDWKQQSPKNLSPLQQSPRDTKNSVKNLNGSRYSSIGYIDTNFTPRRHSKPNKTYIRTKSIKRASMNASQLSWNKIKSSSPMLQSLVTKSHIPFSIADQPNPFRQKLSKPTRYVPHLYESNTGIRSFKKLGKRTAKQLELQADFELNKNNDLPLTAIAGSLPSTQKMDQTGEETNRGPTPPIYESQNIKVDENVVPGTNPEMQSTLNQGPTGKVKKQKTSSKRKQQAHYNQPDQDLLQVSKEGPISVEDQSINESQKAL